MVRWRVHLDTIVDGFSQRMSLCRLIVLLDFEGFEVEVECVRLGFSSWTCSRNRVSAATVIFCAP